MTLNYHVETPKDAADLILSEDKDFGNIDGAVVKFTRVDDFTTLSAEYALKEGDIVFHFFPPLEAFLHVQGTDSKRVPQDYLREWSSRFERSVSPVAEEHFRATYPVLAAQFIPEMQSWWVRAGGFANRLNAEELATSFIAKMDAALDAP